MGIAGSPANAFCCFVSVLFSLTFVFCCKFTSFLFFFFTFSCSPTDVGGGPVLWPRRPASHRPGRSLFRCRWQMRCRSVRQNKITKILKKKKEKEKNRRRDLLWCATIIEPSNNTRHRKKSHSLKKKERIRKKSTLKVFASEYFDLATHWKVGKNPVKPVKNRWKPSQTR